MNDYIQVLIMRTTMAHEIMYPKGKSTATAFSERMEMGWRVSWGD